MKLALLKTGIAAEPVRVVHGDYDAMFRLHLDGLGLDVETHDVVQAGLPDRRDYDAVLVTGSPASAVEPEAWAQRLADWLNDAVSEELPLLGVCYGHQILAHAIGGEVRINPAGFELGTYEVELTEAGRTDRLLGPLSPKGRLLMPQVHGDDVARLPPEAVLLAHNAMSPVQAFRLGRWAWGVQFHPEMTLPIMQAYVPARANLVEAAAARAGKDPAQEVGKAQDSLRATPQGPALLRRFVELVQAER